MTKSILPRTLPSMLAGIGVLAVAIGAGGCVATAVVTTAVAVEMINEQGYTLTVKAEAKPRELYDKLVATLKSRNPSLEVLEENPKKLAFRARATDADGVKKWVSFVVAPLPDESSQLLVEAGYANKEGRKIRDWMLEQIDQVFREMGIEWKLAAANAIPEFREAAAG